MNLGDQSQRQLEPIPYRGATGQGTLTPRDPYYVLVTTNLISRTPWADRSLFVVDLVPGQVTQRVKRGHEPWFQTTVEQ